MAKTVQYSSYTFPSPAPFVAENNTPVYLKGVNDHTQVSVDVIGFLTGENLSGLHVQKMQMISGLLDEFETLSLDIGGETRDYAYAKPTTISFSDSDLTTTLPYQVTFEVYESGNFSEFYGLAEPRNIWSFSEGDNRVITATHTVSARGIKSGAVDPLQNAIDFVTGNLNGFEPQISLFLSGANGFLTQRNEKIDRKSSMYEVVETYSCDQSDDVVSESGIVRYDSKIDFSHNGDIRVALNGSIYGAIDANVTGALLTTGNFTPDMATTAALNLVANNMSEHESGVYSFIRNGPTTYDYTINSGENKIDFSFSFDQLDNLDQLGNVSHVHTASVTLDKQNPVTSITVQGTLAYNAVSSPLGTGEYESSTRFSEIDSVYSGLDFFALAKRAMNDFANGMSSDLLPTSPYLNEIPVQYDVNKDPVSNQITYSYTYNNAIDYSSGLLNDFRFTITDKIPIQLSSVVETIGGTASQVISQRTIGEFSINGTANNNSGELTTLKGLVSGLADSGVYDFVDSYTINDNNIGVDISRYY